MNCAETNTTTKKSNPAQIEKTILQHAFTQIQHNIHNIT